MESFVLFVKFLYRYVHLSMVMAMIAMKNAIDIGLPEHEISSTVEWASCRERKCMSAIQYVQVDCVIFQFPLISRMATILLFSHNYTLHKYLCAMKILLNFSNFTSTLTSQ